jgi:hypothetical protein
MYKQEAIQTANFNARIVAAFCLKEDFRGKRQEAETSRSVMDANCAKLQLDRLFDNLVVFWL